MLTNDLTPNKNIKNEKNIENEKKKDICAFFETLWAQYPNKKGKGRISDTQKAKLYAIGYEEMSRAIERYCVENANTDMQYWKHGSTFFNSGYIDYLDANYEPRPPAKEDLPKTAGEQRKKPSADNFQATPRNLDYLVQ